MRAELNIVADRHGSWRIALAALLIAIAAGIVSMAVSKAWSAGFSGADEPAHYLNSLFIAQYVREALGSNPMAFATEYYLHYPKISIGHWPPAYYALLSPVFLLFPATPQTALGINLLLAALPAVLAALLLARLQRPTIALAGALLCALTPVALEGWAFFMLDQPLAAIALAATILWIDYVARPAWWRVFAFALLAATAVLIKGNGWLLLFVPPIHLALTSRWRVLASPSPWLSGLLAAAVVGPWYWLTAGISADGFNYSPGPAYAWQALRFNLGAVGDNITLAGLALAAYGAVAEWQRRAETARRWNIAAACLALILATLLLQSLVPVDLDPRYMAPALPPLIVLALTGACAAFHKGRRALAAAAALLALLIAYPGLAHLIEREPKIDLRLEEAAAQIGAQPSVWVIDGTSGAEGAFIAAMAVRDPKLQSYAIRSSRLLAQSDFMGDEYRLATDDPAQVRAQLQQLGIEAIVIARIGGDPAYPHSALLLRAIAAPGSPYRLAARLPHRNRAGVTEVYRSIVPVRVNAPPIRELGLPSKAAAISR